MADPINLDEMWAAVQKELRKGELNLALWDAVAAAKPLALDGDTIVLGLPPKNLGPNTSYLESTVNKNRLLGIIERIAGRRLGYTIIEGQSAEAWEKMKKVREEKAAAATAEARGALEARRAEASWEHLSEDLTKLYAHREGRKFPQDLAALLFEALELVYEHEDRIRSHDPGQEEVHGRRLSRILAKIATYVELPATAVAVEYRKLRAEKEAGDS